MEYLFFILILVVLILSERVYLRLADSFNIIDKPNERSSHTVVTLRGGGVVFYFGVLIYFLLHGFNYPYFMIGLTMATVVSFFDDIKPLSSKVRIIVQFIAMGLVFYQWGLFAAFDWWWWIVALVVCTGVLNAFNFMDGINGITGCYALITLGTLLYIDLEITRFIDTNLLIISILSILVFLFYNFRNKARCFAGDVGSVSMALIIIFASGLLITRTGELSYVVLLAVYGVDSVMTILHRLLLKENIFTAHRKHLYQIMKNEIGINSLLVSIIYMLSQLIINIGYFMVDRDMKWWYVTAVLSILVVIYIIIMKLHLKKHKS